MKRTTQALVALMVLSILSWHEAGQAEEKKPPEEIGPAVIQTCSGTAIKTTSVADPDTHQTSFDLYVSGLDPVPLLTLSVEVGGIAESCLVAHFSVQGGNMDFYSVFHVAVDGVPMNGQSLYDFDGRGTPPVPVVVTRADNGRHGYNFFLRVKPGQHKVQILWAGCCSNKGAFTWAPVLTVEHR